MYVTPRLAARLPLGPANAEAPISKQNGLKADFGTFPAHRGRVNTQIGRAP